MANSQTFSLRIVAVDHYMALPIPGPDDSYSSFQGGKVKDVPVIRIYASTRAAQKTCFHVHRLYVPCPAIHSEKEGDAYAYEISLAMEKALKLKSKSCSKHQHVHGSNLVQAKGFYGYNLSEELFVKIYFSYPHDVSRAADLLLKSVHAEQSRKEVEPLTCTPTDSEADVSASPSFDSSVWISSTVPADWVWHSSSNFDVSSNPEINSIKRQSLCQLEGDATVDEFLNQQFKTYTPLSQTRSDVKMVQSLVPIWEEEHERTGMHELEIPSDPIRSLPEDVLRTLLLAPEFMNKFVDLHNEAESPLCSAPLEKDVRSVPLMTSSPNETNVVRSGHVLDNDDGEPSECLKEQHIIGSLLSQEEDGAIPSSERAAEVKLYFDNELTASRMIEILR